MLDAFERLQARAVVPMLGADGARRALKHAGLSALSGARPSEQGYCAA